MLVIKIVQKFENETISKNEKKYQLLVGRHLYVSLVEL